MCVVELCYKLIMGRALPVQQLYIVLFIDVMKRMPTFQYIYLPVIINKYSLCDSGRGV